MTLAYTAGRVGQALLVVWAAYTVSFFVLYALPGDPLEIMTSGAALQSTFTPEALTRLRHEYGFDRPILVQYIDHLGHAVSGDLGTSIATGADVVERLLSALPNTLLLTSVAVTLTIVFGTALSVATVFTRWNWLRDVLVSTPALGVSLPTFWVGLVLVQLVAFQWKLLPAFGAGSISHTILPAITLALPGGAMLAQILTRNLVAELDKPYAEVVTSKGASLRHLVWVNTFRNAAGPTLSIAALLIGSMIAGAVVVETVFAWDGIGRIASTAVQQRDIPMVQGVVIISAAAFAIVNLGADLGQAALDPRIRRRQAHA